MDSLQMQFIQSRNIEHKLSKAKRIGYSSLLSLDDPTRLNRNIGTNVDGIILDTMFIYNNAKEAYQYSNGTDKFNLIKPADTKSGKSGEISYKGNTYLVLYYNSPVRTIVGNSFISSVPVLASYSNECKSGQTRVFILPDLPHYLLCDNFTETCGKALLCPGVFKFVLYKEETIAIYYPIEVKNYLSLMQNQDIYISELQYSNSEDIVSNMMSYLVNFHTYKVQRGYYSPKESPAYRVFRKYGMSFNTKDKSYYEGITDSKTIDKISLPFHEYNITTYLELYTSECNLVQGNLKLPIFCNMHKSEDYNTPIYVDIRVIDLNFIWGEKTKESSDQYPSSGYYSLTPDDNTFLLYSTRTPNTLVATYGYLKDNHIILKE